MIHEGSGQSLFAAWDGGVVGRDNVLIIDVESKEILPGLLAPVLWADLEIQPQIIPVCL